MNEEILTLLKELQTMFYGGASKEQMMILLVKVDKAIKNYDPNQAP